MKIEEAKQILVDNGYIVEAQMSLADKITNAKNFNNNNYTKDENLLIKIAEDNGYKLMGVDVDEDEYSSHRLFFEKKYKGETITFNAALYYDDDGDCQINYDFDYESGNDYFDEDWAGCLQQYETEAITEIDRDYENSGWDEYEDELDEDFNLVESKTAEKFDAQDVVDAMYRKFDPDFGGLNGWSCNVDDNDTVFIQHKNTTIEVKPLVRKQAVKVVAHTDSDNDYPGKNWKCFDKTFVFDGSESLKDFFKGITYSIKFIGK